MRDLGDLSTPERPVPPDDVEDDSPVVLAAALRIFSDCYGIGIHRVHRHLFNFPSVRKFIALK